MSATDFEPDIDLVTFLAGDEQEPRRRLLMIVNPYASTVSDRLRNLVVSALRGVYEVDAVDTERRDHATELCREAARGGLRRHGRVRRRRHGQRGRQRAGRHRRRR